jgi:hypothetical protein
MNNPMEYFRKGAEKKKAESLKGKSMYQDGDEFIGPKTEAEASLENSKMLNDLGPILDVNRLREPTPPPGKFFGRRHPRFGYEILDEDPVVTARKKQEEAHRNALMKNPPKSMGRPPKPRSMVQNEIIRKLIGE